jgi:tRNA (mo5U34)-methyltransferase
MTSASSTPISLRVRARLGQLRRGPLARIPVPFWLRQPARRGRPNYGKRYRVETLPAGMSSDELRRYVGRMSWYHSIELADGVVTNGIKPREVIQREWDLFALGDLRGRSLLDIGGVDGGFAFRAEQAGASPVAVLDHYVWSAHPDAYGDLYRAEIAAGRIPPAPHESDVWDPEGLPARWRFDVARQALHSRVRPLVMDFMDCDLRRVGTWDVVLYLGVLYHMEDPLRAMRRVAAVTRRQALIETEAVVVPGHPEALWRFFARGEHNNDRSTWWAPNMAALLGLVGAAGFRDAEVLSGEPDDVEDSEPIRHYRAIVRAIK